ncbi:MAG: conditioned medium-induced protein 4 [Haloferacaceae archaeon]
MDEKTESLRDLFVETTGTDAVTEEQTEDRGTLAGRDDDLEARVRALVTTMRERDGFSSALADDVAALVAVARGFHDGEDDDAIAAALDVDESTVRDARLDLHLVRDADREPPAGVETRDLRRLVGEGASLGDAAATLDCDPADLALPYRAALTDAASRRANDRFRAEFAALLTDADLAERLTELDDGLREATEDIETDVSF